MRLLTKTSKPLKQLFFAITVAMFSFVSSSVSQESCPTAADLMNATNIATISPCTVLDGLYLRVRGGQPFLGKLSESPVESSVEIVTKIYLLEVSKGEWRRGFDTLISALPLLGNLERGKEKIYSAFIALEYYRNTTSGSLAMQHKQFVLSTLSALPLSTEAEVSCFIEADLPNIDINNVMKSTTFSNCISDKNHGN